MCINNVKIDWTNFLVELDCTTNNIITQYNIGDINPRDFLKYAIEDFSNKDERGLINALTNAKRAIDCQIDWILNYLGYDYKKFNKNNYPYIQTILKESKYTSNTNIKIKFIEYMEIAPSFLISKIRLLRNKLEHEYYLPEEEDVKEGIEIAKLFIDATENIVYWRITNKITIRNHSSKDFIRVYLKLCNDEEKVIELTYKQTRKDKIEPKDREYIFFVKAMILQKFSYLPQAFDKEIDKKYIHCETTFA